MLTTDPTDAAIFDIKADALEAMVKMKDDSLKVTDHMFIE
jgi:hypothetical protein